MFDSQHVPTTGCRTTGCRDWLSDNRLLGHVVNQSCYILIISYYLAINNYLVYNSYSYICYCSSPSLIVAQFYDVRGVLVMLMSRGSVILLKF